MRKISVFLVTTKLGKFVYLQSGDAIDAASAHKNREIETVDLIIPDNISIMDLDDIAINSTAPHHDLFYYNGLYWLSNFKLYAPQISNKLNNEAKSANDERYASLMQIKNNPMCVPFEVYLNEADSSHDKLYCRINNHPEINGKKSIGKIYFADDSQTHLKRGPVKVTALKEMPYYGFIIGENITYKIPSINEILNIIDIDNFKYFNSDTTIDLINFEFGKCVKIGNTFKAKVGEDTPKSIPKKYIENPSAITITLFDYIVTQCTEYPSYKSFIDTFIDFKHIDFIKRESDFYYTRNIWNYEEEIIDSEYSALINSITHNSKLVKMHRVRNITYAELDKRLIVSELAILRIDEIETLRNIINKINNSANNAFGFLDNVT